MCLSNYVHLDINRQKSSNVFETTLKFYDVLQF